MEGAEIFLGRLRGDQFFHWVKGGLSIVNVNLLFSSSTKEIYVTCTGWFVFWPKLHWMLIQLYPGVIKAVLACNVILAIIQTSQCR